MAEPAASIEPLHPHQDRLHGRTHMFVAATLYSDTGSCPVNIRNMSRSGALIEGAVVPKLDTPVTLRRGSLEASARIVWLVGRKAGVAFTATVDVADWMSRNPDCHQTRVDEIVHGLRSARPGGLAVPAPPRPTPANAMAETGLRALRADLIKLEQGLTADIIMVATHPELQLLDVALQRVERLLKAAGCS